MTLSPAAQAVLDAVCDNTEPDCDTQHLIAAALRAAADQVVPEAREYWQAAIDEQYRTSAQAALATRRQWRLLLDVRNKFLTIAAELEGAN